MSMLPPALARRLYTLKRFTWQERCWWFIAWCLLGFCRAVLLLLPFRKIAPKLGVQYGDGVMMLCLPEIQWHQAKQIGRVVRSAARHTPWESKCLVQAMAAKLFLSCYRIPYVLYFGVAKGQGGELKAHAWVSSGPVFVTGGGSFQGFGVVSVFVPDYWLIESEVG